MSVATISQSQSTFLYSPSTLDEAFKYAEIIATSGLCPDSYKGKPKDILIATQMGAEIGLKWLQALRCIGVINGRPFVWGDGLFYLAKKDKNYKDSKEYTEGSIEQGNLTAYCTIELINGTSVTRKFSQKDAITAGLWNKKGPWSQYPERMLQMRARGFCCRDACPGMFFNLLSEDEVININDSNHKSSLIKAKGLSGLESTLGVNDQNIQDAEIIEPTIKLNNENKMETDIDEPYIDPDNTPLAELKMLIGKNNIDYETTYAWCKKAGVYLIDELSPDQINKAILFLKAKENKNAI